MALRRSNRQPKSIGRLNVWVLVLILFSVVTGCQRNATKDSIIAMTGFSMGTSYSIKIVRQPGISDTKTLHKQIKSLLSDIDTQMSTYLAESEISQFNKLRETNWFSLSPRTFAVVSEALRISRLSLGAFDITIGGLVELWGFGRKEQSEVVPDVKVLEKQLKNVGYEKIELKSGPAAIRKTDPLLMIDLSAIAKGYAVDRVAQFLEEYGVKNFLVEVGGEIKTRGLKDKSKPWRVAIERPTSDQRSIYKVVEMTGKAMATSGDYRNFFEKDGKRYSHTLNPKTGWPIQHDLASVTVIHQSCMTADALATALMVLGPDNGLDLAKENHIAALFIQRKNGKFKERMTLEFNKLL